MLKYFMLVLNVNLLAFIVYIPNSYSIDIEYYIDEEYVNDSLPITIDEPDARRTFKTNVISKEKKSNTFNYSNLSNTLYYEEKLSEKDILSYQVESRKMPLYNKSVLDDNKDKTSLNYTEGVTKTSTNPIWTTSHSLLDLKTFKEYDYKYDQNEDDDVYQVLRYQTSDIINNKSKNYIINNTPYARFFNLEPAVDQEISTDLISKNKVGDNVWYVPHEFPCWELPILYGELGSKKKKSEVFLIYGGNLVNVIDPWTKEQSSFKTASPLMSHAMNKWCEAEPCYGDHTLCLFSNKRISNICDKDYKVHVPPILHQFTIVNTINAMRNRVANGLAREYSHLPTAANMKQITYDYDLEKIAEAWLRQCLPGAAPCSALDGNMVSQLECTKYMKYCCLEKSQSASQCVPKAECYINPVIGCLHVWFSSAGEKIIETDIHCGRTTASNFNTIQLLWAKTSKIGCAYGERSNGDIRVVCNFSPGAPFYLDTKLFCGIIAHRDIEFVRNDDNITDPMFLSHLGIKWNRILSMPRINFPGKNQSKESHQTITESKSVWGVDSLTKIYEEGWVRKLLGDRENGTRGLVARLVARYKFIDESESRCDSDESVYETGAPGSTCVEKSRKYHALCYDFRDPTPGYRLIAIVAAIALFSLILYDLFSGVVRQTVY